MTEIALLMTVIGVGGLGLLVGRYWQARRPLVLTLPKSASPEVAAHMADALLKWDRRRPIVLQEGATVAELR